MRPSKAIASPSPKSKPRQERLLTVGYQSENSHHQRPYIRLCGQWLADAGFPVAARIRVQVRKNRLVLTPIRYAADDEAQHLELRVLEILGRWGALSKAGLRAALGKDEATPWNQVIRRLIAERKIAYPVIGVGPGRARKLLLTQTGYETLAACIKQ
ncbi:MAG TPA: SymE family type I addiction module toxin [Paucimonas sp.]|nr:SymE family type I addiction module toxin [Paucimonas sp.]